MRFASAITTKTEWTEAVEDLTLQVRRQWGSGRPDFVMMFVHPQFVTDIERLVESLLSTLGAHHLIGCTGGGVIGNHEEIEKKPAVSLLAAELPAVKIQPFHVTQQDLEESSGDNFWHFKLETTPTDSPNLLLVGDPFSIQAVQLVQELSEAYPGAPLIGGLASGGRQPGENRLFINDEIYEEGAIGVVLTGNVIMHTIVSQGCKPIGEPLTVTRADKNLIFELGGRPPGTVLQEMLPLLPQTDQQLARTALFLGRVINEYKEEFGRGDFLIRQLIGLDQQSGALAVGDWMRTGQTVQFQVRDGESAHAELRQLLIKERDLLGANEAQGAVLFSCLGRGEGMYGVRNHDINTLHEVVGAVPTAGFFCNGEIGPVGARTFVHGFTSVVGLFTEAGPAPAK